MSKKTVIVLVFISCILFIVGFLLYMRIDYAHENFQKEIKLTKNGIVQETLSIDNLELKPGDVDERVLNLTCDADGDYKIDLDFKLKEDEGLSRFVVVEIQCNEQKTSSKLDDLLEDGQELKFDCTLNSNKKTEFVIRYILPLDTGDEAQGKGVAFDINLTASHK